jgi:hypothetical protein
VSSHPTDFQGSVIDALREVIERQIPGSRADVNGGGGHFAIEVASPAFAAALNSGSYTRFGYSSPAAKRSRR